MAIEPYWDLNLSSGGQGPFIPNHYAPANNNGFGYLGQIPFIQNPAFSSTGSSGPLTSSSGGGSMGDVFTSGNITNSFGGGGKQTFNRNQPDEFNPYQFMPAFQQFQRPDSPVAGLTPEEEFLRQFGMGQLLGPREGEDLAWQELMRTVGGEYLSHETNPYLNDQINALGDLTAEKLNESINQILSRAGVSGALGGSRAALMQGEAAGEMTRGFNQIISDMLQSNYQNERNRQLGGIPGLLNIEQMPFARTMQAMGLAGIPREQQQKLIDAQMAEWQRMQSERLLPLQVGQSVLGQRMGQTIPIVQPQQSLLGGLGSLTSGIGSLMSGANSMGNLLSNFWGGSNPFAGQVADVGWSGYGATPDWTSGFDAWDMGGF